MGVVLFKLIKGFAGECVQESKRDLFCVLCLKNSLGTKESCCLCCNSSALEMTFLMCAPDLCLSVCSSSNILSWAGFVSISVVAYYFMGVLILYREVYRLCLQLWKCNDTLFK